MPVNITVRNIPDPTRDVLARRAADRGQSMQEYLRAMLIEHANRRSRDELFDAIRAGWEDHRRLPLPEETPLETMHRLRDEQLQRINENLDRARPNA